MLRLSLLLNLLTNIIFFFLLIVFGRNIRISLFGSNLFLIKLILLIILIKNMLCIELMFNFTFLKRINYLLI